MNQKSLLISFLIHILIIAPVLINSQVSKTEKVEIVEVQFKTTGKMGKRPGNKLVKKSSVLFPQTKIGSTTSQRREKAFNDSRTFDTDINEIFGESGNQNWSYYKEIYQRIDSNLIFDSILAQYSHFGRVYVQFKITEEGLFKIEDLKTQADDSILKVHVLRTIKKSLSEPLAAVKKSKLAAVTLFQAEFDFEYGDFENNFYKQNNFGKPVFVFKRSTLEKPVPHELLEQLLAGGVTPNISLMYERWQKYNKKKHLDAVQFDPFENYKRDAFFKM